MTQAEEIAYLQGRKAGEDMDQDEENNPYKDSGLREAWARGFDSGRMDYLDSRMYG